MKLLIIFFLTLLSLNCYCQKVELMLEKLIHKYSSEKRTKTDTSKQITNLRIATFSTANPITNIRTGTKDSEQGELSNSQRIIYYDIGFSSGAHMNLYRKSECSFYSEEIFSGHKTRIGLLYKDGISELIITILSDNMKSVRSFPANFWVAIKDENDIEPMLEIASSYNSVK